MVKKIVGLLNLETGGLHEAAFLLGLSALGSQILGLVRDRLLAANFGAGVELDIYYSAFRLPDLLYVSLASLISVTVVVPLVAGHLERGERQAVKNFLDSLLFIFCLAMVLVSGALFWAVPYLSPVIFSGFNESAQTELILLTRILLLSPFFLGLSNLLAAVTQSVGRFLVYATSPILYNLGIIAGIVLLYPVLGLPGLALGVVLGAFLHFAIQWPVVRRVGLLPRLTYWPETWPEVKKVLLISVPRTITLAAHQVVILILVVQASLMAAGSVAVFNFAWNLQSVPLAIIGVSYSVAALPVLARLATANDLANFKQEIILAARHIIFWSLPATVLFVVLRAQVVRVILGAGAFDWQETRLVAAALALFVISVTAQSLILLLVRAYYAAGRTAVPLIVNSVSSLLIIVLSLALVKLVAAVPLIRFFLESLVRVDDLSGTVILVLPLAFSLGLIVNLAAFLLLFRRHFGSLGGELAHSALQIFSASVFGGFVAYEALAILGRGLDLNTFIGIFSQGLVAGLAGIIATALLLLVLKNREMAELVNTCRRFLPVVPVAPGPEEL